MFIRDGQKRQDSSWDCETEAPSFSYRSHNDLDQGSPTYGPQPGTGPWALGQWAEEMAGQGAHAWARSSNSC